MLLVFLVVVLVVFGVSDIVIAFGVADIGVGHFGVYGVEVSCIVISD